jgi:hypothetical protein
MASREEVEAARLKMRQAEEALRAYANRVEDAPVDIPLHMRFTNDLRNAEEEYVRLQSELNRDA